MTSTSSRIPFFFFPEHYLFYRVGRHLGKGGGGGAQTLHPSPRSAPVISPTCDVYQNLGCIYVINFNLPTATNTSVVTLLKATAKTKVKN